MSATSKSLLAFCHSSPVLLQVIECYPSTNVLIYLFVSLPGQSFFGITMSMDITFEAGMKEHISYTPVYSFKIYLQYYVYVR